MLGEFARHGGRAVAEHGGEVGAAFRYATGRFEEDERAGNGRELGNTLAPRRALVRQEALEEEAVGRQARDHERRKHC